MSYFKCPCQLCVIFALRMFVTMLFYLYAWFLLIPVCWGIHKQLQMMTSYEVLLAVTIFPHFFPFLFSFPWPFQLHMGARKHGPAWAFFTPIRG